ncbi:WhiB family transcriptional regulator [Nocardiopsis sp. JB363]|uniref:WhiB family transcriptional regulator n=1 Tax=Nocardiopsis sp. JB363 TaxID=1434837 RepID=UPI00097ACE27|nr:WhiB family transcriptional regulator [Nocardiopsis sp. JB363]SIO87209.1 WhiB-type transcription regulator [Nocardiopsis sp. JB363]
MATVFLELFTAHALCRRDPDRMFVPGQAQHQAKTLCTHCPIRTACLAEALQRRIEFGVWGGMTERERRALLRRRRDVTDWKHLLREAKHAHDREVLAGAAR